MSLLQDYLREQVAERGGARAFLEGDRTITFAELEAASNRLAHQFHEIGCVKGDRICLLMDRSIDAVIAMLAALKVGCSYVPVDPAAPAERTAHILVSVEPAALVVGASSIAQVESLQRTRVVNAETSLVTLENLTGLLADGALRADPPAIADQPTDPPPSIGSDQDVAYIMYTSGSTGVPKGTVISHSNVRAFVDWAVGHFGFAAGDRHSWQPALHFDLSTLDVYGALAAGVEVHLVPTGLLLPHQVLDFISEHRLTQWFSVPSAMAYASRSELRPPWEDLHRVLWCGEVMPTPVLRDWMGRAPQARFTNLYGPTETTVASSYYDVSTVPEPADPSPPIGFACDGEELLVLDENLDASATGEIGEIYIAGAGVGPGYWRDPAQTNAAFVPDPRTTAGGGVIYRTGDLGRRGVDGCLTFVGRRDTQIKSRGYRIELGEIEVALAGFPEVAEAAVIPLELGGFEGVTIGCALSLRPERPLAVAELRARLLDKVPLYMIPTRWHVDSELPKNGNGKIDRARLKSIMTGDR